MPAGTRPNPPANVFRFSFEGEYGPTTWANVLWVHNGGGDTPSVAQFQTLLADYLSEWGTLMIPHLSTAVTLYNCKGLYYDADGPAVGAEATGEFVGEATGAGCPASVACAISWAIAAHYRGGHPRTYLPGIPQSALSSVKSFGGEFLSDVAAAANAFQSYVIAEEEPSFSDLRLGTVSFVHDKAWRSPPIFRAYQSEGAIADSRVDSQRHRLGPDV